MQDQPTRESTAREGAAAPGTKARVAPSSSRMLTSYMSDIEQLLDEQQWEAALREALDLPQLAVALGDPQLSVSAERLKGWCDEWIRPEDPDRNARGADYERVSATVIARASGNDSAAVPSLALKRLRLRRLVVGTRRTPYTTKQHRRISPDSRYCAKSPVPADRNRSRGPRRGFP